MADRHIHYKHERNAALIALVRSGVSQREAARRFGISQPAVSQIIARDAPDLSSGKAGRGDLDLLVTRIKQNRACPVCGYLILRGPRYSTCSTDCATVYRLVHRLLVPENYERKRRQIARWHLQHDTHPRFQRWARRVLDGTASPPIRRFHEGSRQRRIARALGIIPPPTRRTRHLFP